MGMAEITIQGDNGKMRQINKNYEHVKMFSFQNTYNLTFLLRNKSHCNAVLCKHNFTLSQTAILSI